MRDVVDTLMLLGVLQGAALALGFSLRRNDVLANRLLAALITAVAALLLAEYCESRWALAGHPHLLALAAPLPFTFGPLLYLYIVALTRPVSRPDPRWLLHALPALFDLAYMTANFYVLEGDAKLALVREIQAGRAPASLHAVQVLQALQAVGYLAASWQQLQRYGDKMRGYFSDLAHIDLRWLRAMVIANAAVWSLAIASTLLRVAGLALVPAGALTRGVDIGSTVVIFLTGYMSLWQPGLFDKAAAAARVGSGDRVDNDVPAEPNRPPSAPPAASSSLDTNPAAVPVATSAPALAESALAPPPSAAGAHEPARVKYQRNRIEDAEAEALAARLLALMREQRPYRDGGLTLPVLAEAVGVTPHTLSQILNVRLERTFYAFVNSYRVAELKQALADPTQNARGVLELAHEVGFNSKSTLNSFFKHETGLTPTQYRLRAQARSQQIEAA